MCVLRLTQLYNILLLSYYWLLVSGSGAITRPIFTKNFNMLGFFQYWPDGGT